MDALLGAVRRIESRPRRTRNSRPRNPERDDQIRAWGLLKQAERQSPLPLEDLAGRARAHFKDLGLTQRQLERILAPIFD
jgi:hypothetical protein